MTRGLNFVCNEFPVPGLNTLLKKMSHRPKWYKNGVQIVQMASVKAIEARKRAIEQELLACESELSLHAGDKTKLDSLVEKSSHNDTLVCKSNGDLLGSDLGTMIGDSRTLLVCDKQVPVLFANESDEQFRVQLSHMKAWKDWGREFDSSLTVDKILVQNIDMFGPKVGFVKFKADVRDKDRNIPSIVFMRGGSVAILPVFVDELTCKKYTVLTIQPRVPTGLRCFPEIPAGMVDDNGDFAGVAAKEMEEEMNVKISAADLIDITPKIFKYPGTTRDEAYDGLYPSAGGCDEFMRFFLYVKICSSEEIKRFEGRCTGNLGEGEKIILKIIPLEDIHLHAPDMKALSAYFLYKQHVKDMYSEKAKIEAVKAAEREWTEEKERASAEKERKLAVFKDIIRNHEIRRAK